MLKPALQLWLENGFKPSLTATEVQDNPGRYVRAKIVSLPSSPSPSSPSSLSSSSFHSPSSPPLTTMHDIKIQIVQTEDENMLLYTATPNITFHPHSFTSNT